MTTTTKALSRRKPERRIRLLQPIQDGIGAMQITIDGEVNSYVVLRLSSDFGSAFRLIKEELVQQTEGFYGLEATTRYNVNLDGPLSTYECLGFCKRGHCKHIEGLTVLRQRGLI